RWSSAARRSDPRSACCVPASFFPTSTPRTKTAPSTTMAPIRRLTTCRLSSDRSYFSRIRWVSRIKAFGALRPGPQAVKFPGCPTSLPRQRVPGAAARTSEVEGAKARATPATAEGQRGIAEATQPLPVLGAQRLELTGGEEQLAQGPPGLHRERRAIH